MAVHQVISGNYLLQRIRREGIDAGQVHDGNILVAAQTALLLFNSNARPVSDKLAVAGQVVEHRRFSAVRIACESNGNGHDIVTSSCSLTIIQIENILKPPRLICNLRRRSFTRLTSLQYSYKKLTTPPENASRQSTRIFSASPLRRESS